MGAGFHRGGDLGEFVVENELDARSVGEGLEASISTVVSSTELPTVLGHLLSGDTWIDEASGGSTGMEFLVALRARRFQLQEDGGSFGDALETPSIGKIEGDSRIQGPHVRLQLLVLRVSVDV